VSGNRKIVPELYCSDFPRSLQFYTEVLGFRVRYTRPAERFAYLYPFGRGMNLEIGVDDVDAIYARAQAAGTIIFLPLEERWYRRDAAEVGNRQFVAMDPDGYLLRFAQDLGVRPRTTSPGSKG
jgi:catechol 2,3-dioxygenase-like lactoylglutathione lyase family enzyme